MIFIKIICLLNYKISKKKKNDGQWSSSTIVNMAIKERVTKEAMFDMVSRRIASKINWHDIKTLGVIGMDEIFLKKYLLNYAKQ